MSFIAKFMDARRISLSLFVPLLVLAGCSNKASEEEIRILGTPPGEAYLGVEYIYDLGVDGGDGIPTYSLSNAPRWLAIEPVSNAARKGVILRGIPGVTGGGAGESDLGGHDGNIVLVANDGGATARKEFQITVVGNALTVGSVSIAEGEDQEVPKDDNGVERSCIVRQSTAPGVYVPISLARPSVTRIVARFKTEPGTLGGNSAQNAEAEIDYLSHAGTVTFEPGETLCYVKVAIIDDHIAEDSQSFGVVVDKIEQGLAELGTGGTRAAVTILDNEPIVSFDRATAVVTEGNEITITAKLDRMPVVPVTAEFEVVTEDAPASILSTASSDDFVITPGAPYQIVFDPESETPDTQTITIQATRNNDRDSIQDEFLTLRWKRTETSREGTDLLKVFINQWTEARTVDLGSNAAVKEMLTDEASRLYVAYSRAHPDTPGITVSEVAIYDRFGSATPTIIPFGSRGGSAYSHVISDIYLLENQKSGSNEFQYLYMTGATTGNTDSPGAGGTDVLVEVWRQDNRDLPFRYLWSAQYGTPYDDIPHALYVQNGGTHVSVVGETQGNLSGGPSAGPSDALLVIFDGREGNEGKRLVERIFGSEGRDVFLDATGTGDQQLIATGYSDGEFEEVILGGKDAIVGSYNDDGQLRRLNQFGNDLDNVSSTAAMVGTDIVLAGYTEGALVRDVAAGGEDAWVAYMGNASAVDFFHQFGTVGDDRVLDIVTDQEGNIFFTGYVGAELDSDRPHRGGRDAMLGRLAWAVPPPEPGEEDRERDEELTEVWLTNLLDNGPSDEQGSELVVTSSEKLMLLKEIHEAGNTKIDIRPYNKAGESLLYQPKPDDGTSP